MTVVTGALQGGADQSKNGADPGKGPLLLSLAVGAGLKLGHHCPALGQGFFCCCNPLTLPNLSHAM